MMLSPIEALEQRIAQLESTLARQREDIDRVDDWSEGVMAVHLQLVPLLLKQHPQLAPGLMTMWERSEDNLERAARGQPTEMQLGWYDAQAVLARVCRQRGVPSPSGRSGDPSAFGIPLEGEGNSSPRGRVHRQRKGRTS